jgi:hypothetical protein
MKQAAQATQTHKALTSFLKKAVPLDKFEEEQ